RLCGLRCGDDDSLFVTAIRKRLLRRFVLRIDREDAAPFTRREIVLAACGVNTPEIVAGFSVMKVLESQSRHESLLRFIPAAGAKQHDTEVVQGARVKTFALRDG